MKVHVVLVLLQCCILLVGATNLNANTEKYKGGLRKGRQCKVPDKVATCENLIYKSDTSDYAYTLTERIQLPIEGKTENARKIYKNFKDMVPKKFSHCKGRCSDWTNKKLKGKGKVVVTENEQKKLCLEMNWDLLVDVTNRDIVKNKKGKSSRTTFYSIKRICDRHVGDGCNPKPDFSLLDSSEIVKKKQRKGSVQPENSHKGAAFAACVAVHTGNSQDKLISNFYKLVASNNYIKYTGTSKNEFQCKLFMNNKKVDQVCGVYAKEALTRRRRLLISQGENPCNGDILDFNSRSMNGISDLLPEELSHLKNQQFKLWHKDFELPLHTEGANGRVATEFSCVNDKGKKSDICACGKLELQLRNNNNEQIRWPKSEKVVTVVVEGKTWSLNNNKHRRRLLWNGRKGC